MLVLTSDLCSGVVPPYLSFRRRRFRPDGLQEAPPAPSAVLSAASGANAEKMIAVVFVFP